MYSDQMSFSSLVQQVSPSDSVNTASMPADVPFMPEPAYEPANVPAPSAKRHISVSVDSITTCGDNLDQPVQTFDVVLTVGIDDGVTYKRCKVLKTLAFDKEALYNDTLKCATATVVESKEKTKKDVLKTMRELAGVPGKDNFV